jgi:hypothetical protein
VPCHGDVLLAGFRQQHRISATLEEDAVRRSASARCLRQDRHPAAIGASAWPTMMSLRCIWLLALSLCVYVWLRLRHNAATRLDLLRLAMMLSLRLDFTRNASAGAHRGARFQVASEADAVRRAPDILAAMQDAAHKAGVSFQTPIETHCVADVHVLQL